MAGILGNHGNLRIVQKQAKAGGWQKIFTDFWDVVTNFLGINLQGKSIVDLNVEQTLDLITDEILQGRPNSNLRKLDKNGWNEMSVKRRREPAILANKLRTDPTFNALQEVKKKFEETGDLDTALTEGYKLAKKDFPNYQDFADIFKEVAKVKLSPLNPTIALAKAGIIQRTIKAKRNALDNKRATDTRTRFREILNSGKGLGKISKWVISPNAEDIGGLFEALLPKGGKEGAATKKELNELFLEPYTNAIEDIEQDSLDTTKAVKEFESKYKFNDPVYQGYTVGDAILLRLAQQQGVDSGITDARTIKHLETAFDMLNANEVVDFLNQVDAKFNTNQFGIPLHKTIFSQSSKASRKKHLAVFNQNVKDVFTDETWKMIEAKNGKDYMHALKSSLDRMKSGRNRTSMDSESNAFNKWLGRAVGTTMFLNFRSAALQLISTVNYAAKPGMGFGSITGAWTTNLAETWAAAKELRQSAYINARFSGEKFDLLADQIGKDSSTIDKVLKQGFILTKLGDIGAILIGGAPYYNTRKKQLAKENPNLKESEIKRLALNDFIRSTEESQQSSDPARISKIQASSIGRIIYAFANTPFQYARISKRRIGNLASGRSKAEGTIKQDIAELAWYSTIQAGIFSGLQSGLFALLAFGDNEEEQDKKMWQSVEGSLTSLMKTFGNHGAVMAAMYNVYDAAINDGKRGTDAAIQGLGISPPLQQKFKDLKGAIDAGKKAHKTGDVQQGVKAAGEALAFGGIPVDRLLKKVDNLAVAFAGEAEMWQRIMRALGWSDYSVGGGNLILPEYKGGKKKDDLGIDLDLDLDLDLDSPLDRGAVGQAFRDGTIQVDPNLSPIEREKTILHEQQHVKQMQEDGLDYDDANIYYKNKKHPRKGGKILYNGKWHAEGTKELPWEKEAFQAESPLKRTTGTTGTGTTGTGDLVGERGGHGVEGGVDEDRFDKDGNLITDPKLIDKSLRKADAKADQFTTDWYNDPETRKRLKHQTGLTDEQIDERIKHATGVETREALISYADAESHDPGTFMGQMIPEGEEGYFPGRIDVGVNPDLAGNEGLLEHEQAHQLRFDNQLGYKASKILGKAKEEYLNNPGEIYGNMQEFRSILGLKGSQRDLTPAKIKKIIKDKGLEDQPDVQQLLYNFDIDKLSKALNTIAEAKPKKKKNLRDLYA